MTGKVVTFYSNPHVEHTFANTSDVSQNLEDVAYIYTPMQVATAVTLMVGIFQVNVKLFLKVRLSEIKRIENKEIFLIVVDNNVYIPIRHCNNIAE